jgi:purine-nucleoside phosphorylase
LGADGKHLLHEGLVWSTDAPYRETLGKVMAYQAQGVLGVDMETSALFTLAAYRRIDLAVALVVSDDLSLLKWVHGFRDPRFSEARQLAVAKTLEVICSNQE